jgi:ribosome modulation factor
MRSYEFAQGYYAARCGVSQYECPYEPRTFPATEWTAGWLKGVGRSSPIEVCSYKLLQYHLTYNRIVPLNPLSFSA